MNAVNQQLDPMNLKIRLFIGNNVVENLALQAQCDELTARLAAALQENQKLRADALPKQGGKPELVVDNTQHEVELPADVSDNGAVLEG